MSSSTRNTSAPYYRDLAATPHLGFRMDTNPNAKVNGCLVFYMNSVRNRMVEFDFTTFSLDHLEDRVFVRAPFESDNENLTELRVRMGDDLKEYNRRACDEVEGTQTRHDVTGRWHDNYEEFKDNADLKVSFWRQDPAHKTKHTSCKSISSCDLDLETGEISEARIETYDDAVAMIKDGLTCAMTLRGTPYQRNGGRSLNWSLQQLTIFRNCPYEHPEPALPDPDQVLLAFGPPAKRARVSEEEEEK